MSDIEIHGFAQSTFVRTARMAAHEKGVAHTLVPLAFGQPEHIALHPFAKMPAMRHGDVRLYETMAITAYIDGAFPGPALQPDTALDRARMWQAVSVVLHYGYPALVTATLGEAGPAGADPASVARVLDCLETLAGDGGLNPDRAPTLADLFAAPVVAYYAGLETGAKPFDKRPKLAGWHDRMQDRDSFRETASP
ncbi:MAG: glutathione S-transferase family protein [Inquilinaceae bacterium]